MNEKCVFGAGCVIHTIPGNFNTFGERVNVAAGSQIGNCNTFGHDVTIGKNCFIGNNCTIEPDVTIGVNVSISNNVVIASGVTIGDYCIIKSGAVIKSDIYTDTKVAQNVVIERDVSLSNDTFIGVGCHLDRGVKLGDNCILHENCVVRGNTEIGFDNEFLPGSVIGFWPKDIGDPHYEGKVRIGDHNFFGEYTVINVGEATDKGDTTAIGNKLYAMDFVTINHNDQVAVGGEIPENPKRSYTTILSSKVSLAGHVEVGVGANLGMQAVVHQFTKVGAGAMVGMNANVAKNVVPFGLVIGNKVVGFNKRPLAENLGFGSYEDSVLKFVLKMVRGAAMAGEVNAALRNIAYLSSLGENNDKAYEVIVAFLKGEQNGRKLMKWGDK